MRVGIKKWVTCALDKKRIDAHYQFIIINDAHSGFGSGKLAKTYASEVISNTEDVVVEIIPDGVLVFKKHFSDPKKEH